MQLLRDIRFHYQPFRREPAYCRLRLYRDLEGRFTVLVSEAPDNPGMSITNYAEHLATQIAREFGLDGESTRWIEHYPGEMNTFIAGGKDTYSVVTFTWHNGVASAPTWRHLASQEVQANLANLS